MKWMNGDGEYKLKKKDLERIHKNMFAQQQSWLNHWKDIRDYINPYLSAFDEDTPNDGTKRDNYMINSTPLDANNTQAAGMQSGITSPSRPWVRLTVPNPDIQEIEEVRYWCDEVTQLQQDVFSRSNFYNSAHMFYKELGAFGTAAMMIIDSDATVITCRTFTIGEYAIGCDKDGKVNRFARTLNMTCAEMVDKFGFDNCPVLVQQNFRAGNFDATYKVKWLVLPNEMMQNGKIDTWNKPFLSFYWSSDIQGDDYLEIGGYDEFPVMCGRWETKGSDIYGRGPGSFALSDSKMLQNMEDDILVGIKKLVDPPMVAPSDVVKSGGVNTLPNGVTYYDRSQGGGDNAVRPAIQINLDIQKAEMKKQAVEQAIEKRFFADLFRMLEQFERGNVTAREVIERVNEKMSMIGPVLDRLQTEFLKPVIDRVFAIMARKGWIPDPPEVIDGMELKIEYISVMAQAQKMTGLTAIEQFSSFVGSVAAVDPRVLDKWDRDETVDRYGEMLGIPPSLIVSDDKVAQKREADARQAQAQQQMQMAMLAAQGAKTLSETDTGQNNALTALTGGPTQ